MLKNVLISTATTYPTAASPYLLASGEVGVYSQALDGTYTLITGAISAAQGKLPIVIAQGVPAGKAIKMFTIQPGQKITYSYNAYVAPVPNVFIAEWKSLYDSKSGERGIYNVAAAQKQAAKYGRRDPEVHYGTNPCSEIILRPYQFCNLSEVVLREKDTKKDIERKVELATILGTWQATLTDFKYLRKIWKDNTEEERLLGVSLTGQFGHKFMSGKEDINKLETALVSLREYARVINSEEAAKIGINESAAITCVKPSGTVSQLTGVSSGMHPWHSEYYIRTVRADNKDPLTELMKAYDVPNEPDVMKVDSTTVFSFPVRAPEGAILRNDLTAIEHLNTWLVYQRAWCEHKPSITVSVKEEEWMEVGAWVYKHFDEVSGISFLPHSDHTYKQAPYQECSKEEYEELLAKMPKAINWSDLSFYEKEDMTTGSQSFACSADNCEIVDLTSSSS